MQPKHHVCLPTWGHWQTQVSSALASRVGVTSSRGDIMNKNSPILEYADDIIGLFDRRNVETLFVEVYRAADRYRP